MLSKWHSTSTASTTEIYYKQAGVYYCSNQRYRIIPSRVIQHYATSFCLVEDESDNDWEATPENELWDIISLSTIKLTLDSVCVGKRRKKHEEDIGEHRREVALPGDKPISERIKKAGSHVIRYVEWANNLPQDIRY